MLCDPGTRCLSLGLICNSKVAENLPCPLDHRGSLSNCELHGHSRHGPALGGEVTEAGHLRSCPAPGLTAHTSPCHPHGVPGLWDTHRVSHQHAPRIAQHVDYGVLGQVWESDLVALATNHLTKELHLRARV